MMKRRAIAACDELGRIVMGECPLFPIADIRRH